MAPHRCALFERVAALSGLKFAPAAYEEFANSSGNLLFPILLNVNLL